METCNVRIGEREYIGYIAETEKEKEIGLSNCEELEKIDGREEAMLFVYDTPQHLDF